MENLNKKNIKRIVELERIAVFNPIFERKDYIEVVIVYNDETIIDFRLMPDIKIYYNILMSSYEIHFKGNYTYQCLCPPILEDIITNIDYFDSFYWSSVLISRRKLKRNGHYIQKGDYKYTKKLFKKSLKHKKTIYQEE